MADRTPREAPHVQPAHFTLADGEPLLHLARPNPILAHLEAAGLVRLARVGDYAYIPSNWRDDAGGEDEDGVPTSYHTSVQFVCRSSIVDDRQGKVEILDAQFADMQPESRQPQVSVSEPPFRGCTGASAGCAWRSSGSRRSSSTTITTRSTTGRG